MLWLYLILPMKETVVSKDKDKDNKKVPQLSNREIIALNALIPQFFLSPEIAANLIVNPRPTLLQMGLSDSDIDEMVAYFKYIEELVQKDHKDDW